jgi:glycosyltransferase involved in cell wall biosynthesis
MSPDRKRLRQIRARETKIPEQTTLPRLVMVVTCKGRLSHLKLTLPGFLFQLPPTNKLVVVDYGDPDGAFDYCKSIGDPRIVAVQLLTGTEIFNLSHARNCGANLLPSDILAFVDADSLLHADFLSQAAGLIRIGRAVLTRRNLRDRKSDTCGLCCVRTDVFHRVRGYDEAFQGWGPEDSDFYKRVNGIGVVHDFPAHLYPATLQHSNMERTRFYQCKNLGESARQSSELMRLPRKIVNPNGYGRARVKVFSLMPLSLVQTVDLSEPTSSDPDHKSFAN